MAPALSLVRFGQNNRSWLGRIFPGQADNDDRVELSSAKPAEPPRFSRINPNMPLQVLKLEDLQPEHLVFLVQAYGIQSPSNPGGVISQRAVDRLSNKVLKNAILKPYSRDPDRYEFSTQLSNLASELAANRQLFVSQSFTVSAGGTLVPAEQAQRAFRIGMPWEMSFEKWYQNVTLYAPISPYKLREALRGVSGLRGRIPNITVPDRVDPSRSMGSEDTHKYQLKTVKDLEATYDFFMQQDPDVQLRILKNLPWFTNTHSAWHQMSYATGKDGEYLERIFPGHFWLGMTKLPMFAISVPRPALEVLHRDRQIGLEKSHPGIDRFDYYGIPDPKVPNLTRGDRYITRTLAEGEMLADNPPPHPITKPTFQKIKLPYKAATSPHYWSNSGTNDQQALEATNERLAKTRSIKPILSYEQLERSVTGQVVWVNRQHPSADPMVNAALSELDQSFNNWQHMSVRDYWHTSYHLDMNNHIMPGLPVKDWHLSPGKDCNEWYPCENAQGCAIPIPGREGKGGINLNDRPDGSRGYVWPNPQMWDILTYHAFNTFDVEGQNPDYMYSGLLSEASPQQKAMLKAKLGYLIQANLGLWRREHVPQEARSSMRQILKDPAIARFFPKGKLPDQGPGMLPNATFSPNSHHLIIDGSSQGFYIPVVTMLQYVPHGSENNNPLHHGGPLT